MATLIEALDEPTFLTFTYAWLPEMPMPATTQLLEFVPLKFTATIPNGVQSTLLIVVGTPYLSLVLVYGTVF
ncbi:MAG: hypothetical protein IJ844_02035, partial [Prevotella sp.]|nr:hypothetical protein [Prevotella sp.]